MPNIGDTRRGLEQEVKLLKWYVKQQNQDNEIVQARGKSRDNLSSSCSGDYDSRQEVLGTSREGGVIDTPLSLTKRGLCCCWL